MKSILIIQDMLSHYRKEVYNRLASQYKITILHSGKSTITESDLYSEIIVSTKKIGMFKWQKGVDKAIKSGEYDVVIAMFDLHWLTSLLAIRYRKNVKFIWWGHRYEHNQVENTLKNKVKHKLIKLSSAVLLYNDSQVEVMLNYGIPKEKIFIAENTIFVDNLEDLSGFEKSSFLFIGRTQKYKRVDLLIKQFAKIIHRIPDYITVDIVGEGPENIRLKQLAKELNVSERVKFHGKINDSQKLKELYKKAIAYVSPDAVGLGAQHSFAYGTPVVTTSEGYKGAEYEKLENNINSILFKNEEEFREGLIRLITDTEFRVRLGRNAYKLYSTKLTIDNMVQGFIDAIES